MHGQRQDEGEDTNRRDQYDPAHEYKHGVAERTEELSKHLARRFRAARDRDGEENRKEDERHHRAARGGGDRIFRQQRDEPRGESLSLTAAGSDLLRRFDGPGRQLLCAMRRKKREKRRGEGHHHRGGAGDKKDKDK